MWRFLKLEIELPYDPAIPMLGIHTEENTLMLGKIKGKRIRGWQRMR